MMFVIALVVTLVVVGALLLLADLFFGLDYLSFGGAILIAAGILVAAGVGLSSIWDWALTA